MAIVRYKTYVSRMARLILPIVIMALPGEYHERSLPGKRTQALNTDQLLYVCFECVQAMRLTGGRLGRPPRCRRNHECESVEVYRCRLCKSQLAYADLPANFPDIECGPSGGALSSRHEGAVFQAPPRARSANEFQPLEGA